MVWGRNQEGRTSSLRRTIPARLDFLREAAREEIEALHKTLNSCALNRNQYGLNPAVNENLIKIIENQLEEAESKVAALTQGLGSNHHTEKNHILEELSQVRNKAKAELQELGSDDALRTERVTLASTGINGKMAPEMIIPDHSSELYHDQESSDEAQQEAHLGEKKQPELEIHSQDSPSGPRHSRTHAEAEPNRSPSRLEETEQHDSEERGGETHADPRHLQSQPGPYSSPQRDYHRQQGSERDKADCYPGVIQLSPSEPTVSGQKAPKNLLSRFRTLLSGLSPREVGHGDKNEEPISNNDTSGQSIAHQHSEEREHGGAFRIDPDIGFEANAPSFGIKGQDIPKNPPESLEAITDQPETTGHRTHPPQFQGCKPRPIHKLGSQYALRQYDATLCKVRAALSRMESSNPAPSAQQAPHNGQPAWALEQASPSPERQTQSTDVADPFQHAAVTDRRTTTFQSTPSNYVTADYVMASVGGDPQHDLHKQSTHGISTSQNHGVSSQKLHLQSHWNPRHPPQEELSRSTVPPGPGVVQPPEVPPRSSKPGRLMRDTELEKETWGPKQGAPWRRPATPQQHIKPKRENLTPDARRTFGTADDTRGPEEPSGLKPPFPPIAHGGKTTWPRPVRSEPQYVGRQIRDGRIISEIRSPLNWRAQTNPHPPHIHNTETHREEAQTSPTPNMMETDGIFEGQDQPIVYPYFRDTVWGLRAENEDIRFGPPRTQRDLIYEEGLSTHGIDCGRMKPSERCCAHIEITEQGRSQAPQRQTGPPSYKRPGHHARRQQHSQHTDPSSCEEEPNGTTRREAYRRRGKKSNRSRSGGGRGHRRKKDQNRRTARRKIHGSHSPHRTRRSDTSGTSSDEEYSNSSSEEGADDRYHRRGKSPRRSRTKGARRRSTRFSESDTDEYDSSSDSKQRSSKKRGRRPDAKLDPATYALMLSDLKKTPTRPFDGDSPARFHQWINALQRRIKNLGAPPEDAIEILLAHTDGAAFNLIELYAAAYSKRPKDQLNDILNELETRFGSGEHLAQTLYKQLKDHPKITATEGSLSLAKHLRAFSDACRSVSYAVESTPDLAFLNQKLGLADIREKLPSYLNARWRRHRDDLIADDRRNRHPKFHKFCSFLKREADSLCGDLNIVSESKKETQSSTLKPTRVLQTSSQQETCAVHETKGHRTADCITLWNMLPEERRTVLSGLCEKCLGKHNAKWCRITTICARCDSEKHCTAAHITPEKQARSATVLCTKPSKEQSTKDCSKTVLVEVSDQQGRSIRAYAILDDQSAHSFCSASLLDSFKIKGPLRNYALTTLSSERHDMRGRVAKGLKIRGVGLRDTFTLPPMTENNFIPDNRDEIPSPQMIASHPEIAEYSKFFHPPEPSAEVAILLGRDSGQLMWAATDQRTAPFVYETYLGHAIVGSLSRNEVCLQTRTLNQLEVTPLFDEKTDRDVFRTYADDEMASPSPNDMKFMAIMEGIQQNDAGYLQVPLPFKTNPPYFPDNKRCVFNRQSTTLKKIGTDTTKLSACIEEMKKNIEKGYVEEIPNAEYAVENGASWCLPVFPVTHPKKKKIRLVFDAAAKYFGVSLNSQLLTGPALNNNLRDVLTRFREDRVAFIADVEQMFCAFKVPPAMHDYMRFYWWSQNDPTKPLAAFRAKTHVFGNTSSPSVATFCLRRAANTPLKDHEPKELHDHADQARNLICERFYVDDGLGVAPDVPSGIAILKTARYLLQRFGIRLHKIVSNSTDLLRAFPESERATDLLVPFQEDIHHKTLGIGWNTREDNFSISVDIEDKPFTRRSVLSIIQSVYDPLGFVAPVVLEGKLFMRRIALEQKGAIKWDKKLPEPELRQWNRWLSGLPDLKTVTIPRSFVPNTSTPIKSYSLHIFADASFLAIGAVAYLKASTDIGTPTISFVNGESKLSPKGATSIVRLELCAAVQATEMSQRICQQLTRKPDSVSFYTDSRVVLAYIANSSKHFSRYVQRRLDLISKVSTAADWNFIEGTNNPADLATKPTTPARLKSSEWFSGPKLLGLDKEPVGATQIAELFEGVLPEVETPQYTTLKTAEPKSLLSPLHSGPKRWFTSWTSLLRITRTVIQIAKYWVEKIRKKPGRSPESPTTDSIRAKHLLYQEMQKSISDELGDAIKIPCEHRLAPLCPYRDAGGLVRVGGRLRLAACPEGTKHPVLISQNHPWTKLLIQHFHAEGHHQGHHITQSLIRNEGVHIERFQAAVKKVVFECVTCRITRGKTATPIMADLPAERTEPTPPFSAVGIDVFGHFTVSTGPTTRKNAGTKKVWTVLFTCLASRAVHTELITAMDASAFINALKRFIAIRGPCKLIRSDRGTNFTGAAGEMTELHISKIVKEIANLGIPWVMNPPHASNFGGVWERKIGQIRRCLDETLRHVRHHPLSYDELATVMAEATNIVNSTPLWLNSSDPNDPPPLSPNTLLTQKVDAEMPWQEISLKETTDYGPKRWKKVQALTNIFWERWESHYLSELQTRNKWNKPHPPFKVGDVVVVKDDGRKRNVWPIGRVTKTERSHDDVVRKAEIRMARTDLLTKPRTLTRPVNKLVWVLRPETKTTTTVQPTEEPNQPIAKRTRSKK